MSEETMSQKMFRQNSEILDLRGQLDAAHAVLKQAREALDAVKTCLYETACDDCVIKISSALQAIDLLLKQSP